MKTIKKIAECITQLGAEEAATLFLQQIQRKKRGQTRKTYSQVKTWRLDGCFWVKLILI
jgi:hypothetical protein